MKRTSNHSEQRLFREEVLSFTREICVCAHLTQTRDALEKCAEMGISVKNMPDSIFFASHIYMTLAILCRRRHKVAIIAELNLKFSSRFLRQRNACGMEISVKNMPAE